MGDKKKKQQQKGGLGTKLVAITVLVGVAIGAAFWFAPETMQALRDMLGV